MTKPLGSWKGMGLSGEICYRDKPSNARRPMTEWLAVIQANTRGIGHVALRLVGAYADRAGTAKMLERVGARAVLISGEKRLHARVALAHRTLIRLTSAYAPEISKHIRIGGEVDWQENAHRGQREHHNDVGCGEFAAGKVVRFAKSFLDQVEHTIQPNFHREQDGIVWSEIEPAKHHVAPHVRLQVAVGEMKPVEVLRKIGMGRAKGKTAAAMLRNDVFHDCAGFGENQVAISDHRRGAERMKRDQRGWGEFW